MILLITPKGRHLPRHGILTDSKGEVVTSVSRNGKPQVYKIINKKTVAKIVSKHARAII
jgi:hypothetical protein